MTGKGQTLLCSKKKKQARKRIQGTKHWSASPLSLRILKIRFSYKLFLGMWRTGRQLETASKGVSRKNLAWPTWLPPTVTASATEGENSGNHLYSARLLRYLHVVPSYLSVGYGLDEWWRIDFTVRLKQSIVWSFKSVAGHKESFLELLLGWNCVNTDQQVERNAPSASSWITAPLGGGIRVPEGRAGTHRELGKLGVWAEWKMLEFSKDERAGGWRSSIPENGLRVLVGNEQDVVLEWGWRLTVELPWGEWWLFPSVCCFGISLE